MSILKASQLYHILYIHNYRNCMPGTYRELAIIYLSTYAQVHPVFSIS